MVRITSEWVSSLETIAANAQRLFEDARMLFENGRYATSLSLSILCIEEIGKHYVVKRAAEHPDETTKHQSLRHIEKQGVWGAVQAAESSLEAIESFLSERGYKLSYPHERTDRENEWLESDEGKIMKDKLFRGEWRDEVTKVMIERSIKDGSFSTMRAIQEGEINQLKQNGFYVDLDDDFGVKTNPLLVRKETAEEWLRNAEKGLGMVREEAEED